MRNVLVLLLLSTAVRAEGPAVELTFTLVPEKHSIDCAARIPLSKDARRVTFELSSSLSVDLKPPSEDGALVAESRPSNHPGWTRWDLTLPPGQEVVPATVHVHYTGELYDPPKAEGGLRHVAGGHTNGTIGPEGVYLHGGTGWYPNIDATMVTYSVEATVPKGWHLVGQGKRVWENDTEKGTQVRWEDPLPASSLDVVAGPYIVTDDKWNDVQVSTYLFEGEKELAQTYLAPAKQYLEFYSKLLGPYPYPQLSIVENFFSTGYGMPSYTLLGREVVQMAARYTGAVGLGHEIVHNWWGNGVFVDESEGNWCEGLTTYCANYYWVEAHDGAEEAKKARRHILERFSILAKPEDDFPLREFKTKTTEMDDEVGYDKACMLFHTIRRRVGDEAFWKALKEISSTFRGRAAKWSDFGGAFDKASGQEVGPWIDKWIGSKGIPTVSAQLKATDIDANVALSVKDPLPCIVPVRFDWDKPQTIEITMPSSMGGGGCPKNGTLKAAIVDPDYHVFHRLAPEELVPCLNRVLSATKHVIVRPTGGADEERAAYEKVVARLTETAKWDIVTDSEPAPGADASVLYLGGIGVNHAVEKLTLPQGVTLAKDGYEVAGKKGAAPDGALLLSFTRPDDPSQVATLFLGLSADAATKAQRYLFYYGWQSWYTFAADGKAADRGDFPLGRSPLDLETPR